MVLTFKYQRPLYDFFDRWYEQRIVDRNFNRRARLESFQEYVTRRSPNFLCDTYVRYLEEVTTVRGLTLRLFDEWLSAEVLFYTRQYRRHREEKAKMCHYPNPLPKTHPLDIDKISKPVQTADESIRDLIRKQEEARKEARKEAEAAKQAANPVPRPVLHREEAVDATVRLMLEAAQQGSPFANRVVDLCHAHLRLLVRSYETSK